MRITKRNGAEIAFDISKIVDAISKANIRAEEKRVEKKIESLSLFEGVGGVSSAIVCDDDVNLALHHAICEIVSQSIDEAFARIQEECSSIWVRRIYESIARDSELENLQERREELRKLRKLKTERVSAMIRAAWLNRNTAVGRSSTSAVTDLMLLSIPTPPTFKAAKRSLEVGGAVVAF